MMEILDFEKQDLFVYEDTLKGYIEDKTIWESEELSV